MVQRPGWWGRVLARVEGEVPADTLEAYRRAGGPAYELHDRAESHRAESKQQGIDPWETTPAQQVLLLASWNAFVLQTMGDQFLEADYRIKPATAGFVPPVTAEQVLAFYRQVEGWLSRARQAESSTSYRIDVDLPAELPPWSAVEPCPRAHMEGMIAAARLVAPHAESLAALFVPNAGHPDREAVARRVREMIADAKARADYAERLYSHTVPADLHEQIERSIKGALEQYYRAGQVIAMPSLADRPLRTSGGAVGQSAASPLPGQSGFDPWCLTDPESRALWKRDPKARRAVDALWRADPNPARTLAIQAEIDAALARGDVAAATGPSGRKLGFFYCCPWGSIYVAKRAVTIGGRRLPAGQEFTFDVSAEAVAEGGPFKREVLVGSFSTTTDVDYCDPSEGGHRD